MTDVLIIGAGPAGLSAGITCAKKGMSVKILDEYYQPGGRLLGQLYEEPDGRWWNGIEETEKLIEQIIHHNVDILCETSVFHIELSRGQWVCHTTQGEFKAQSLLLATGAAEMPVPVPGWTLPGVMSIGAAQVMTNVQRVKVGEKGIIIGINALSTAIALELRLAGIKIESLLLPSLSDLTRETGNPERVLSSLLHISHMAPSRFLRTGSQLMKNNAMRQIGLSLYPRNGFKVFDIPVQLKRAVTEIYGDMQVDGVKVVDIRSNGEPIPGSERDIPVDFVCIAGGLYPLAELADVAGCPFRYIPSLGGHVPVHNQYMQTPVTGLYVAGNITGIESAKVAMAQGVLAGMSIAYDRGYTEDREELDQAVHHVKSTRQQAHIQFHPDISIGREQMEHAWHQLKGDRASSA